MRNVVILFAIILSATVGIYAQKANSQVLPSRYDEQRFYVEPVLENGKKLNLFTDTGGGLFLFKDSAENLGIIEAKVKNAEPINFPKFKKNSSIPTPLGSKGKIFILSPQKSQKIKSDFDGMLGQQWFADRIWTFDYFNKKLILWDKTPKIIEKKSKHRVKLGFQKEYVG